MRVRVRGYVMTPFGNVHGGREQFPLFLGIVPNTVGIPSVQQISGVRVRGPGSGSGSRG